MDTSRDVAHEDVIHIAVEMDRRVIPIGRGFKPHVTVAVGIEWPRPFPAAVRTAVDTRGELSWGMRSEAGTVPTY